jgi:hypothetical protein
MQLMPQKHIAHCRPCDTQERRAKEAIKEPGN